MQFPGCLLVVLAGLVAVVSADAPSKNKLGNIDESDVMDALGKALDEGRASLVQGAKEPRLEKIREALTPTYAALPKNDNGKLPRQVVRYALHRFFVKSHGWFIRGLEPSRGAEKADLSHHKSDQLREWVPLFLQDVFEQKQHHEGADLDELIVLASALEHVVHLETLERMKTLFVNQKVAANETVSKERAEDLIESYYVEYLRTNDLEFRRLAGDKATATDLSDKDQWVKTYPSWGRDVQWIRGLLNEVSTYNFHSLFKMAVDIGETYRTFNDLECDSLKTILHGMESSRPGRVPLSQFWGSKQAGWKFTEKKEYLRGLGLLDEAEASRPYVISTNYVLSRHNCFAPSDVYVICCRSLCDNLMNDLEAKLGAPTASPRRLAQLVASLPAPSGAVAPTLSTELLSRLDQVAEVNGGIVPLHGRLFAQWMHHAYPQDCLYPHASSVVNPHTASEWLNKTGEGVDATEEEMQQHIASDAACTTDAQGVVHCDESTELPWDTEEELLTSCGIAGSFASAGQAAASPTARSERLQARLCRVSAVGFVFLCLWLLSQQSTGKGLRRAMLATARQPRTLLGLLVACVYVAGLINDGLVMCMLVFGGVSAGYQRVVVRSKACDVFDMPMTKMV